MGVNLTPLEADLAVHQKLDDEPNDVGGLTAQALKEKFDEAGLTIQRYLNDTHLPQVKDALGEVLEEAKGYADRKVVTIGAGDMASAVYDTKGRREDVFEYAMTAAEEVLGDARRFGYLCAGSCGDKVASGETKDVGFSQVVDPRGLWDAQEGCFVVPQGARAILLTAQVMWGREYFAQGWVSALVNGQEALKRSGPADNSGKYIYETLLFPLEVQGGDQVKLQIAAKSSSGNQAEVHVQFLRAEIML